MLIQLENQFLHRSSWKSFLENYPTCFKSEVELRILWSNPLTKRTLLEKSGFSKSDSLTLQELVNMEKSDLFDVLEYVFSGNFKATTLEARVAAAHATIFVVLNNKQKEFIEFALSKYIESGVDELDQEKLLVLLTNKYQSLGDATDVLGDVSRISRMFVEFQKYLYEEKVA